MRTVLSMRWLAFIALATLLGCGVDGGVGGTGISTISGNVALGGGAAQVENPSDLEGIGVEIAGTDLQTQTDATGYFEIEGEMPADVTVEFTELDGTVSMLDIGRVPYGGIVALRNVRFNRNLASADSIEVTFEGNVVGDAICAGSLGTVQVADTKSLSTFSISLDENTRYSSRTRTPSEGEGECPANPTCADLLKQRTIKIYGLQDGATIDAQQIQFQRCRPPGRTR